MHSHARVEPIGCRQGALEHPAGPVDLALVIQPAVRGAQAGQGRQQMGPPGGLQVIGRELQDMDGRRGGEGAGGQDGFPGVHSPSWIRV
jgi:hypothetical protein